VLCRDADARRAHLRIATRIDSDRFTPVTMRTVVDGVPIDEQHQTIAAGQNDFEWTIDIIDPHLWWPRALGDQPLTEVAVEVVVDGEVSDRRQRRTGLRQIVWDDWVCSVNGERIFLKGANILPTSAGPANATSEMIRADLQAAVDLGLDALRVHGHIADRALYDAADESASCSCRTSRCSGATLARCARRRSSRREPPSTRSATIRRSRCGRRTTTRPRPTPA
jgi:beta-mannosidase